MKLIFPLFFILFLSQIALAHCPLCVGATGMAVATARFYGVNDMITGLFAGVFILSTSLWFHISLKKRNKGKDYIPQQSLIIIFVSIIMTLITFYYTGLWSGNSLFGTSNIIVGTIVGSFISGVTFMVHDLLRSMNDNKNYVPFQPIVLTSTASFLSILAFYAVGVI